MKTISQRSKTNITRSMVKVQCSKNQILELLSKDEVELASTLLSKDCIKSVCPVDTHHTNHWKEYTNTKTSRTFHLKWIELTCF